MEILSDTVFKGNVTVEGNINVTLGSKLSVSEFELSNDTIQFHGFSVKFQNGKMATTDQIKNINLGSPEIPANCTRFYFHRGIAATPACVLRNSDFPILQVYKVSDTTHNFQLAQMDIEYCTGFCSASLENYYIFIGNIADHTDVIKATEFVLSIRD